MGTRILHVLKSYGKEANLLVIENMLIISCPHYSSSYLTTKALREIEKVKGNRSSFAVERNVSVALFI